MGMGGYSWVFCVSVCEMSLVFFLSYIQCPTHLPNVNCHSSQYKLCHSRPCPSTTSRHWLGEHLSSGPRGWLFQEKSKRGSANKTKRQLQPGQWFGSKPNMVGTFVNFPFVHSDISFLIVIMFCVTVLCNHNKYIARTYAILSVCLKKIARQQLKHYK